jgi:single-strand DNA-binding protein
MIKLQVIGNLGKDCTTNNVNGRNVINFSVAHTEKYKNSQGQLQEKTTWVECAYWTDRTAIAPYLKKGTQVYVEGNPDVRSYTTNDGRNGASLQMRVQNIQLLGSRSSDGNDSNDSNSSYSNQQNTAASNFSNAEPEIADDLPF